MKKERNNAVYKLILEAISAKMKIKVNKGNN
jgi:hypothetical protein